MKIASNHNSEFVPLEGKPNKLKSKPINSSKLLYDKGNVKPEDRKEFGIKERTKNKSNKSLANENSLKVDLDISQNLTVD